MSDLPDTDALEKLLAEANEIASERDERAAESMMMAEAHKNAGHADVAWGWDAAAEHALDTARVIRTLAAEVIALRKQVQAADALAELVAEAMSDYRIDNFALQETALAAYRETRK